jgi:hypothetical protein
MTRPLGNPNGMGKAAERSTRGWLLDRTWSPPEGLSTGALQTCQSRTTRRSGAHVGHWSPISGVSSNPRDVDVNAYGSRRAGGGPRAEAWPCWGLNRSTLSNGSSAAVPLPCEQRNSLCPARATGVNGRACASFSGCAAARSWLRDQYPRVHRFYAIRPAARRKNSHSIRTSPIAVAEAQRPGRVDDKLLDPHLGSTTGSDRTSSVACRDIVRKPYDASKR